MHTGFSYHLIFHCGTKLVNSSFMKINYVIISDQTKYFGKTLDFKFSFNPFFFMNFNPDLLTYSCNSFEFESCYDVNFIFAQINFTVVLNILLYPEKK